MLSKPNQAFWWPPDDCNISWYHISQIVIEIKNFCLGLFVNGLISYFIGSFAFPTTEIIMTENLKNARKKIVGWVFINSASPSKYSRGCVTYRNIFDVNFSHCAPIICIVNLRDTLALAHDDIVHLRRRDNPSREHPHRPHPELCDTACQWQPRRQTQCWSHISSHPLADTSSQTWCYIPAM